MGSSNLSLKIQFIIAAISASTAVTFSNPFEVVKIRLQLQGELQRQGVYIKSYNGLLNGFYLILTKEGIRGIQKGLSLAYPYTITMNGTRLGLYNTLKNKITNFTGLPSTHLLVGMLAGATTGAIASVIANPFYVSKTRLQCQSEFLPVGHQHYYRNGFHALVSVFREEGMAGYFRGLQAAINRMVVASSVQLGTYDKAKELVIKKFHFQEGLLAYTISACIGGFFMTIVLNPLDVVLTRLQNQPIIDGKGSFYKGSVDCILKIAKIEGLYGFYKGTLPHYARLAPHTVILLVVFEKFKKHYTY
jgi:solute carrier family 25 protein 34/35